MIRNAFFLLLFFLSQTVTVNGDSYQLPYSLETSGLGLALSQHGATMGHDSGIIERNPALLARQKTYTVEGNYLWAREEGSHPSYQVGVVDGKSASFTAGVSYRAPLQKETGPFQLKSDLSLGLGSLVGKHVAGGISAHYLEGLDKDSQDKKGVAITVGLFGDWGQTMSWAVAYENLNETMPEFKPSVLRAGVDYHGLSQWVFGIGYKERQRIDVFENSIARARTFGLADPADPVLAAEMDTLYDQDARSLGLQAQWSGYETLLLMGSYAADLDGTVSDSFGAGMFLQNGELRLGYSTAWIGGNQVQASRILSSLTATMQMQF